MSDLMYFWMATLLSFVGMAWLALAKEAHWAQVMRKPAHNAQRTRWQLQGMGSLALLLSLMSCCIADPISMAVIVWIMLLALGTTAVALALTWYAPVLRCLWVAV